MKTRRHHNNTALTSTKRGKRKKEVAAIAKRLNIPVIMGQGMTAEIRREAKRLEAYHWDGLPIPKPKKDVILERPEETPDGYGHGV